MWTHYLQERRGNVSLDGAVGAFPGELEGELVKLPKLVALHEAQIKRRQLLLQLARTHARTHACAERQPTNDSIELRCTTKTKKRHIIFLGYVHKRRSRLLRSSRYPATTEQPSPPIPQSNNERKDARGACRHANVATNRREGAGTPKAILVGEEWGSAC